ncbi:MAG: hydroxyacid dehydrogenase [Burkholderiales bacterium]|nr:hydroxyacid dehydrogenase [Burkholderiales bacterium]
MPSTKYVVRGTRWINPAFDERLARETDIRLDLLADGGADTDWRMLSRAHAYHVSAAKDELPRALFVDARLLARCPELLIVSSSGAGYDTITVPDCTAAGVAVVNQAGANADSVAEMALGLMLDVMRRISECNRRLRSERGFSREDVIGRELRGKTLGLVGIGETGRRVAALARAFGLRVLASDPLLDAATIAARGAEAVDLDQLLAQSDIVSLHCPREPATLGLIGAAALARMRRGAILISTARGGVHDEVALAEAIRSGHLGGAGLDVWQVEPPPQDHPLLALPNVTATFHTAGVTHEARRNVAAWGAEQLVGALRGERPPRLVNPQVWPAYCERFEKILGIRPAMTAAGGT